MTIRSMTGYGQAVADTEDVRIRVEVRTVNHRYADLRLRTPADLAARDEAQIRRRVLAAVQRGRVECTVRAEPLAGPPDRPVLNRPLLDAVLSAAKTLAAERGLEGPPSVDAVLAVPGLFRPASDELAWNDARRAALESALGVALGELERERCREGVHLVADVVTRIARMEELLGEMRRLATAMPAMVRGRLVERLEALGPELQLDAARVAQEAALLADRCDVTEELVRLEGHLEGARQLLARPDGEPVGKRLDFLLQEIQRETNTVGSKSVELELTRRSLALKAEIEKVREQVQNLE